jgi:poly-gamma-glutamate capsule biosynthesis protein CapA/YwtB (metallophosphatase superfamily)
MTRKAGRALLLPLSLAALLAAAQAGAQDGVTPCPHAPNTVPAPAEPAVVRIAAVGDIMMGTTFPENILPPGDGAAYFREVRPLLEGDLVFGNLEGALLEGGRSPKCGDYKPGPGVKPCFAFRTPLRYAEHLRKAGFNVMNVANNHTLDFGMEGMDNTLSALDNAWIQPVGGQRVALFPAGGKRVAVVGFSYSMPTPYVYPMLDIPRAVEIVSLLKSAHDLVVVSFHGGAEGSAALAVRDAEEEFLGEKRGNPVRFARAVVDAGADLVLGHGPHVPRALEIYRGKLIAYSLGNFAAYSMFNIKGPSGLGYVLQATLSAETGEVLSFRTPSTALRHPGIPCADPGGKAEALLRRLSEEFLAGEPDADARREALSKAWKRGNVPN